MRASASELKRLEDLEVVIFDFDDTIIDTGTLEKMARMNAVEAMTESGLPLVLRTAKHYEKDNSRQTQLSESD